MSRKRELLAIVIVALIIAAIFVVHPMIDRNLTTAPLHKSEQQNSGSDAPAQTVPPAGTSGQTP